MERMKLNILELAEIRWTGASSMKLGSKTIIYSGRHTHERGVGILFDVTTAKSLGSGCPISDRVVVAKLVDKPLNVGIIQLYAPASDSEDVEVEKFYLRVIRNVYWDQTASVRSEGERSDFKPIKRGVWQGCVMSPDLFNLYM
ncbi:endonuclease exonuclease phosphatase domain containing protein [Plakobranchus ocellatus]|uniref:Endonuclease exonuclease phosphatase domain containing protein n=1 Tax=Plakobranchus ocellatus TaxID=259542 RepID=A0AAV4BAE6_9GAST|nr:endonuclease exonuclease phosphatase domain containing protein [Plakobranchus ocellatus]